MSASDYQNIYSPYEIILYHKNLPAINVHLFIYFILSEKHAKNLLVFIWREGVSNIFVSIYVNLNSLVLK